jgi:hypothetical protein
MLAKALASATAAAPRTYVEDVFSTWLYTGNGSTQTIANGIDLSGKGGLVWLKARSAAYGHGLWDTARGSSSGNSRRLISNGTNAATTSSEDWLSFNSNGFAVNFDAAGQVFTQSGVTYASWTFRKAAKFFDVVTYTGNGTSQDIAHELGSQPGFIIVKRLDQNGWDWYCWHRSLTNGRVIYLNQTSAEVNVANIFGTISPTTFRVLSDSAVNGPGGTYVAYLFAHDAGGFGDSGNDSVVKCGAWTGNGSSQNISLGWEPQWMLVKASSNASQPNWLLVDNMRGWPVTGSIPDLYANRADAESFTSGITPTATGFNVNNNNFNENGQTYIYIAIRRGPMKTPTDATKVFALNTWSGNNTDGITVNTGITTDLFAGKERSVGGGTIEWPWNDRLRGALKDLYSPLTDAETSPGFNTVSSFASNTSIVVGRGLNSGSPRTYVGYSFRRAPGFFDVVAYTGGGFINESISHNLGVKPELVIIKRRNASELWWVNAVFGASTFQQGSLNTTDQFTATTYSAQGFGNPTSSALVFNSIGSSGHASGGTYIAYLFATCSGISKVGSYTGTGTTQQINCGFTAGARFVLIKRTDSTGSWYIWDSARGIISGNDPYLLLNSTAAEVTNTDYIDPYSPGFEISSTAPAEINANGGSYIFLAVA